MASGLLAACGDASTPLPTASSALPLAQSAQAQSRLASLFDGATAEVLAVPGTVFADHDERRGRLVFGVESMSAATAVQAAAARAGLTSSDYLIVLSAPVRLMGGAAARAAGVSAVGTLSSMQTPVLAGVAVGTNKYQCTVGFTVAHSAGRSFITNSHCTDRQGGPEKTQFWQPAVGTGMLVGVEADDPVYNANKACPKEKRCRFSDAARVAYLPSVIARPGEFARTSGENDGSTTLAGIDFFAQQDDVNNLFSSFNTIYKVGIATGTTSGTVDQTCVHANVANTNLMLLCQTFVKNAAATIIGFGDSGAPVYLKSNSGNVLLGIAWGSTDANTFVFSPLEGVVRELGRMSATVDGAVGNSNGNGNDK